MEASGSNAKVITAKIHHLFGQEVDEETPIMIVSSEDTIQIGSVEFSRIELLEAIGLNEDDLRKIKGA